MSAQGLLSQIKQGMEDLQQEAPDALCRDYLAYLQLLLKWNEAYNLSGVKDPAQMVIRHILDSLSIRPFINGGRCLDVGTGAGLPGLILALALPQTRWVLLDSNRKKIRFLKQAVLELETANVEIRQGRVEELHDTRPFDIITSRALGPLASFWEMTEQLRDDNTRLLAMKGASPVDEIAGLGENVRITIHKLSVPGLNEERCLVIMQSGKEP